MDTNSLSRLILRALRHNPELLGITLDANGWTSILDIASCVKQKFGSAHIEELKSSLTLLVQTERIEMEKQGIRAAYGASLAIDIRQASTPTCRLFHGTRVSAYRKIERLGLRPKNRAQVHLTSSIEYAQAIAEKWQDGLVLEIDVKNALAVGITFSQATSHVWFANYVPAEYLMAY